MRHRDSQIGFVVTSKDLGFVNKTFSVHVVYWLVEFQINSSNANLQELNPQNMDFRNIHLTLMCLQGYSVSNAGP